MEKMRCLNKNDIRKNIKLKRERLSKSFVNENSKIIATKLFSQTAIKSASVILAYYSAKNEVNTHEIIEKLIIMNKKVALPLSKPGKNDMIISLFSSISELKPGGFGIMEPDPNKLCIIQPEQIDIVIVPGIAFDRMGNRIGYGKGYYDRFLSSLTQAQLKLGLCFDFQLYDELPWDYFDVPVDCVITESLIIQRTK